MVKRPLVLILGAYLAGMYLAWQGLPDLIVIIASLLFLLIIYIFLFKLKNKAIGRREGFWWCLPVLLLFGFFSMKGQLTEPELNNAFDQKVACELSGKISMIAKKSWGRALYIKNDVVSLSGASYVCENVIVYCYDSPKYMGKDESLSVNYLVGNQITVRGTLQKFSKASNPGQFNEKLYYQIENIDYKMEAEHITVTDHGYSRFHAFLDGIKNRLLEVYESILKEKESGTIIAMLLGEKYLLKDEIKQLYQVNGISHILAISGLHVSLIGLSFYKLMKKCRVPVIINTLATIFVLYSYGVLTNFSVSTNRAVVMMTVMLLAGIFGKTYDMLTAMSLSALIILMQNPLQIMSAGFLLSFGAVFGIAFVNPSIQKLFPSRNEIIKGLYISISAQAATTPFVLWFFYQLPVYGILTNLIILPFVSVLTLTSIIAGIAGMIWQPFGIFLIGGVNYILKFYELVCSIISHIPGNMITLGKPQLLRLFVYFLLIGLFLWLVKRCDKKYLIFLLVMPMLVFFLPERKAGLEITMLDVGQGDAIYMESKSGTTYFIDGGSSDIKRVGNYRIQPFLLSKGCASLDYAIMTHSDEDHISGLKELLEAENIRIKHLILPDIGNKDEAYQELEALAQKKNTRLLYIKTGDYIRDGRLQILCLHPDSGYQAASANAYSTTLSVSYGEFDMLFTGDLEQEGEDKVCQILNNRDLLQQSGILEALRPAERYDVLKVAHHGSKNSTMEDFLLLTRPGLSLISCGKNNSYGHPHPELIARLKHINSDYLITCDTGAITLRTDGKQLVVDKYLEQ